MYGRASGFAILLNLGGIALVISVIREMLNNACLPTRSQSKDLLGYLVGIAVGIALAAWGVSLMLMLQI